MNRTRSTLVESGKSWANGDVSSADYFAHARKAAAHRTLGGRLFCTLREAMARLLTRTQS
ncbi:hypothetical protein AB0D57_17525 [Streptomyces sp. NPDC048275]|uniref:hypothetical protein n=1 Tax=Streptomyces sp. NPDC048275 TaxID=3155629 RepID=UPI0033E6203E